MAEYKHTVAVRLTAKEYRILQDACQGNDYLTPSVLIRNLIVLYGDDLFTKWIKAYVETKQNETKRNLIIDGGKHD